MAALALGAWAGPANTAGPGGHGGGHGGGGGHGFSSGFRGGVGASRGFVSASSFRGGVNRGFVGVNGFHSGFNRGFVGVNGFHNGFNRGFVGVNHFHNGFHNGFNHFHNGFHHGFNHFHNGFHRNAFFFGGAFWPWWGWGGLGWPWWGGYGGYGGYDWPYYSPYYASYGYPDYSSYYPYLSGYTPDYYPLPSVDLYMPYCPPDSTTGSLPYVEPLNSLPRVVVGQAAPPIDSPYAEVEDRGTYPYNGGPSALVPEVETRPDTRPASGTAPADTHYVSQPAKRGKFVYPAYGEKPRRTVAEENGTLVTRRIQ
jgi:hypothetical protein